MAFANQICYEFDEVLPDTSHSGWRPEGLREMVAGASLPPSALASLPQRRPGDRKGRFFYGPRSGVRKNRP